MSNVQLKEFQDRADEADKLLALLKVRLEHIESNAAAVAALPKADKKKSNSGPQPVSDFKEFQASVLAELEEVKKDALRDAEEKNKLLEENAKLQYRINILISSLEREEQHHEATKALLASKQ